MRGVWEYLRNIALRDDLFFFVIFGPLSLGTSLALAANSVWPNKPLFYALMLVSILLYGLSIFASGIRLRHGRARLDFPTAIASPDARNAGQSCGVPASLRYCRF